MANIPEFLLRKLVRGDSLVAGDNGFSIDIVNTYNAAVINGFRLDVDGKPVPAENITLSLQGGEGLSMTAAQITPDLPCPMPLNTTVRIHIDGASIGEGSLAFHVNTREVGELNFTVKVAEPMKTREGEETRKDEPPSQYLKSGKVGKGLGWWVNTFPFLNKSYPVKLEIDFREVIGTINPHIYGHFIEHLERCVYGGVWNEDGSLRQDTLALISSLNPPIIRYPGGNFASGYHWEDGVGAKKNRPQRFDKAWQVMDSNQVGTDEFLDLCARLKAEPYITVNDGSGTPEEAARWVAYCNDAPEASKMGRLRAANGHSKPYGVKIWGVGNEVWGAWQIGTTDAAQYTKRLREFVAAMKAADASLQIVAVGDGILTDKQDDPGRLWNETVLRGAGEQCDFLSFHIYQPDEEGYREQYDVDELHRAVCAAPLTVEVMIQRLQQQIEEIVPQRRIGLALDEWNLRLPPREGEARDRTNYPLRDVLYAAGMLNVFHRQCSSLKIANLAQLVNVLPAIITDKTRVYATAIYYPFLLYQHMQNKVLKTKVECLTFDTDGLGNNIMAQKHVPWLDVTATRDDDSKNLVIGLINRHPEESAQVTIVLQGSGKVITAGKPPETGQWKGTQGWCVSGSDPLIENSFEKPEQVHSRSVHGIPIRKGQAKITVPPCAVMVLAFERE